MHEVRDGSSCQCAVLFRLRAAAAPGACRCAFMATAAPAARSGMSENTAAALSYVLGWITGIIFFLIDKRPYVRFHAAQSIVTFGALNLIRVVVAMIFGVGWMFGGYHHMGYGYAGWGSLGLGIAVISLLGLLTFVLWIYCLIKAGTGQRFILPIAGPIAQSLAGQQ